MAGTRNATRARSTAIARARTEIARSLETRVAAMLKDYAAATTSGPQGGASDELSVVDVSRQITRVSISGSVLRETWTSPAGTVFALVVLDLADFESSVSAMTDLPSEVRDVVREGARASVVGAAAAPAAGVAGAGAGIASAGAGSGRGAGGAIQLITPEEASMPAEGAIFVERTAAVGGGPEISILSPDESQRYGSSFPLQVSFAAGPSGQPVDMQSLRVEYKKGWGIDITPRVRAYVSGSTIDLDQATMPAGDHTIEISIEDVERNRSSRLLTVRVGD